jgi:hypothetical protein|tara:strand:- start:941 stop:1048 length:108 start_codon:yes stop_codon:yes gene_type:complete
MRKLIFELFDNKEITLKVANKLLSRYEKYLEFKNK